MSMVQREGSMEKRPYDFMWMTPLEKHFLNFHANDQLWLVQREREKQDQLNDILTGYSTNGLPPLPELLTLGRPSFDDSIFQLESHWSVLVDNASSLTKRQHDQQEAIWELLNTELSYISQVRVIIDVFKSCLLNIQQEGLLNEIALERLFSNIDQILDSNCHLWQNNLISVLEEARATRQPLNPSLMKMAFVQDFQTLIKPYTRYCVEQKQCVEYMKSRHNDNDLFKTFVQWAEAQKQCNRLKLTDLLVKPMQRLTKYSLLLQAILRKTEEEQQRKDLLEMIGKVDNCVSSIDNQMDHMHKLERLEALMTKMEAYDAVEAPNDECVKILQEYNTNFNLMAPMSGFSIPLTRSLMLHSTLRMKEAQAKPTDVDCFLFTDLILVCKGNKRMDRFKIVRPPMRLDQLVVSELKDKGSFLLIYMNEYHIPIAAYTFHADQGAVRAWLERVRDAQREYTRQRLEDRRRHDAAAAPVAEEVEYAPLQCQGPLTMERSSVSGFPRSDSMESTEGRFLPNSLAPSSYGSPAADNSSPEKSPTHLSANLLERTGSYNELPLPSMVISHAGHQPKVPSTSPEYSPALDRKHKAVKACHSVPNVGQVKGVDSEQGSGGSGGNNATTLSVNAAMGSPSSSVTNLAEPGPVGEEDEESSRMNKSNNQRRMSRNEKRYYTADSIQELRHKDHKDSSIHKRLSWQNENHLEDKLRKKVLSTDSVTSIPSSSGVSSTASLHLNPESEISEEAEMQRSGSSRTLQDEGSPVGSHGSRAKSTPDIVSLFSSLKTGEREEGISSVDMPSLRGKENKKMTQAQLMQVKRLLLNNESDVEASEV